LILLWEHTSLRTLAVSPQTGARKQEVCGRHDERKKGRKEGKKGFSIVVHKG
jgi:hypothetical protein